MLGYVDRQYIHCLGESRPQSYLCGTYFVPAKFLHILFFCMHQVFAVRQVCEKYLEMGKMYYGLLWIWKRYMILSIDMVCSRWSWRKIVESSAELLCR